MVNISGRIGVQINRNRQERRRSSLATTNSTVQVKPQRRSSTASTISAQPILPKVQKNQVTPDPNTNRNSIPELVPHGASVVSANQGTDSWGQVHQILTPQIAALKPTNVETPEEEVGNNPVSQWAKIF